MAQTAHAKIMKEVISEENQIYVQLSIRMFSVSFEKHYIQFSFFSFVYFQQSI